LLKEFFEKDQMITQRSQQVENDQDAGHEKQTDRRPKRWEILYAKVTKIFLISI